MNTAVKKSAKSASFSDEELLQLPLVLNSDQAAKVLGCSRSKLQSMCRADTVEYQRLQNRSTAIISSSSRGSATRLSTRA